MATKTKARAGRGRARRPRFHAPPQPQIIDLGRSVDVPVRKASVEEIVLSLVDGTKLHLKPVVMGIQRSTERYNPLGEPIYQVNVAVLVQTKVPPKLKRKPK